jgi:serine protease
VKSSLLLAITLITGVAAAAPPEVLLAKALAPRTTPSKPERRNISANYVIDVATLKLHEGTGVRLRNDVLVPSPEPTRDIVRMTRDGIDGAKLRTDLSDVNRILRSSQATITRMFTRDEAALDGERSAGEKRAGQELADLNLYYVISFPAKKREEAIDALVQLNAIASVEAAMPQPAAAPLPAADLVPLTANYVASENYLDGVTGIDALGVRALPGGRGEYLEIIDIEYSWPLAHEDLNSLFFTYGLNIPDQHPQLDQNGNVINANLDRADRQHATAVIGVLKAAENSYGMTGIVPSAFVGAFSSFLTEAQWNSGWRDLPNAINHAGINARSGDVILIEQQTLWAANNTMTRLWPPEVELGVLDAIRTAVTNGLVVVETAGNGGTDVDSSLYSGDPAVDYFRANDSGAIIVGAGSAGSRNAMSYSNFGQRVNVQGIGEHIYTLGYGRLMWPGYSTLGEDVNDSRQWYMDNFGGTSGAGPIVGGAALLVQSIRSARNLPLLTSSEMRTQLIATGRAQGTGGHIGPLPNVREAIRVTPLDVPVITATGGATTITVTWSPIPGASTYRVYRQSTGGGAWVQVANSSLSTFSETVGGGIVRRYRVVAEDGIGDQSQNSNEDLAVTVVFTDDPIGDPSAGTATNIRAQHVIELRTAVNALCDFAGTTLCSTHPYDSVALDVNALKSTKIRATDFSDLQTRITSLRTAIGAGAPMFQRTPVLDNNIIRGDLADLRAAIK